MQSTMAAFLVLVLVVGVAAESQHHPRSAAGKASDMEEMMAKAHRHAESMDRKAASQHPVTFKPEHPKAATIAATHHKKQEKINKAAKAFVKAAVAEPVKDAHKKVELPHHLKKMKESIETEQDFDAELLGQADRVESHMLEMSSRFTKQHKTVLAAQKSETQSDRAARFFATHGMQSTADKLGLSRKEVHVPKAVAAPTSLAQHGKHGYSLERLRKAHNIIRMRGARAAR